jgi:hypothetical protein
VCSKPHRPIAETKFLQTRWIRKDGVDACALQSIERQLLHCGGDERHLHQVAPPALKSFVNSIDESTERTRSFWSDTRLFPPRESVPSRPEDALTPLVLLTFPALWYSTDVIQSVRTFPKTSTLSKTSTPSSRPSSS